MSVVVSNITSIEAYMNAIRDIPILSPEEEHNLAVEYVEHNNNDAAQKLVMSHLRFVVYIANKFKGYGLPLIDLIQEGNIGLMKAVKRFDPYAGVRLLAFASHWIRAEINEFVIRNWRLVKVATTKAQRKLFFKLRSQKKTSDWFSADEVAAISKELDVKESDVRTMEGRLNSTDTHFEMTSDDDHYEADIYLRDENDSIEQYEEADYDADVRQQIDRVMNEQLSEREREIIRRRWLSDDNQATLKDIASTFGVSVERVRQLEVQAIKKLRSHVTV